MYQALLAIIPVAFMFSVGCTCCPPCDDSSDPIMVCADDPTTIEFDVVIAGVANNTCTGCANANGTWRVTYHSRNLCDSGSVPGYRYNLTTTVDLCGGGAVEKYFSLALRVEYRPHNAVPTPPLECENVVRVDLTTNSSSFWLTRWRYGVDASLTGELTDCDDIVAMDLPFVDTTQTGCNWSSSTCTVTKV